MALIKDIETDNGIILSYWRIGFIHLDNDVNRSIITMFGYPSKTVRDSGHQPVEMRAFEYMQTNNPNTINAMDNDNPFSISYTYLKTKEDFFSGATDDLS